MKNCQGVVGMGRYQGQDCLKAYYTELAESGQSTADTWCNGDWNVCQFGDSTNDISELQNRYRVLIQVLKEKQNLLQYNNNNDTNREANQQQVQNIINELTTVKEAINTQLENQNTTINGYFNTIEKKNSQIEQQDKNISLINQDINRLHNELLSNEEKIKAAKERNQFKQYITYLLLVLCVLLIGIIIYFFNTQ